MVALATAEPKDSTAIRRRLRVLITNIWLDSPGSSQSTVRDLAIGLLARGHHPIVYSPCLGALAAEIEARGVVVSDNLAKIGEIPDIIHGHHFTPTGEAIIRFPDTPVFFMRHSWQNPYEKLPRFPQIIQYAGVDESCRDRLVDIEGIAENKVVLLPYGVDLTRVPLRTRALELRPQRALAFSKFNSHLPVLRGACQRAGLEYAELGKGADRLVSHPEHELGKFDVVFASGRCALEALCAGSAVICCDAQGWGGLVTSANYEHFRRNNFGVRILTDALNVDNALAEIHKFDRDDAVLVSTKAREESDLNKWLDAVETVYFDIIENFSEMDAEIYRRSVLEFLRQALHDPSMKRLDELNKKYAEARLETVAAKRELERLRRSRMLNFSQMIRRTLGLPYVSLSDIEKPDG